MRFATGLRLSRRHHILKRDILSLSITLGSFAVVLALLQLAFGIGGLNSSKFLNGFMASFTRTSVAYVIALMLALTLALTITATAKLEAALLPIFDVLQSFPSFALFPVLVHALAHSPETVIILVLVITMVWPILFSIVTALKNRREDLEEAASLFGAKGTKRLTHFTLPELMPAIVGGSIIGWGEGWEFIIGAELLVSVKWGIGGYLGELGQAQQNGLLALGITFLMLLLFILNRLIWLPLLRKVTRYQTET